MNRKLMIIAAMVPMFLYAGFRITEVAHTWLEPEIAIQTVADVAIVPYASEETAAELTVVVNKTYPLPASYVPPDLRAPDVSFIFDEEHEKRLLRNIAASATEMLFHAAKQDGIQLYAVSGYRSFDTQKALFAFNSRTKGKSHAERYNAKPGASEHQTGLALDVTSRSVSLKLTTSFGDSEEGKWLASNAHRYGFVIRYPFGKEAVTGYAYEPWHIRYVGEDAALTAYTYQLTLEEMADGKVPAFSQ